MRDPRPRHMKNLDKSNLQLRMSCFGNRRRRNLATWGLCLVIFTITWSSGACRATDPSSSSSSSAPPRKTFDQAIGSPSELAWQAWLLVENKGEGHSALDSSNILRRITPKSIFIAPELVSCPSGYSSDGKGVCKPDPISLDEDAQRQFVLKRLNAKFGNNRKKPADSGSAAGPLQINIPISIPVKTSPPEVKPQRQQTTRKPEQDVLKEERPTIPVVVSQQPSGPDAEKSQDAVAVVIYKLANNTRKGQKEESEKEKTSFFLGTSNSPAPEKDVPQVSQVVPVAEIVDDMNETFSGVVDYKIPNLNLKTILNKSIEVNKTEAFGDSPSTVLLFLSPTKLPQLVTSTQKPVESSKFASTDPEFESTTVQAMEVETKSEFDATIQTVAPLDAETDAESVDGTLKNTEKTYTEDETVYADDETQTEQESEDDYDDTTGGIDDFGDGEDELLKPGEAGMMISSKNQDIMRLNNQKQQASTLADTEDTTSTTFVDTTTLPTIGEQDSFDASTLKSEATEDIATVQTTDIPSTIITTEPSVAETTEVLTTKPVRFASSIKSTTKRSTTTSATTTTESLRETEPEFEPEVILSTQTSTTFGRKKPTHPAKVAQQVPYTVEEADEELPLPLDFHRRRPTEENKRQKPSNHDSGTVLFKDDNDDIPAEFKDQLAESSKASNNDFRRIPSRTSSYVRFPDNNNNNNDDESNTRSHLRGGGGGYVRFPSDEVNSIHNQDNYKDHLLSPYRSRIDYGNRSPSSTKSSVPARQKSPSTHWRVSPLGPSRMDRQQQQHVGSGSRQQQKQKPMLLRFWARMPLVRDLTFYPTTSHGSHNEPIGGQLGQLERINPPQAGRRLDYYKDLSSHEVNRLLAQQLGQPFIGG